MKVDFPDPENPIIETNSFSFTFRFTSLRTSYLLDGGPNPIETLSSCMDIFSSW